MREDRRGSDRRTTGFGTRRSGVTSVGTLAGAGIEFAVAIVVFLYVGKWLDDRFGTSPVLTIIGVFFGAGGGFYSLYRSLMAKQGSPRKPRDK